jgi:hypothetical protein
LPSLSIKVIKKTDLALDIFDLEEAEYKLKATNVYAESVASAVIF